MARNEAAMGRDAAMTPKTPRNSRIPADRMRMAAEFKWNNPLASWDAVAAHVGRDRRAVFQWRQTEAWEVIFREVGGGHVEKLVPMAVLALIKQWQKGNAAGALDVLRSAGYLRPERLEIKHDPANIDAEIEELVANLKRA